MPQITLIIKIFRAAILKNMYFSLYFFLKLISCVRDTLTGGGYVS